MRESTGNRTQSIQCLECSSEGSVTCNSCIKQLEILSFFGQRFYVLKGHVSGEDVWV